MIDKALDKGLSDLPDDIRKDAQLYRRDDRSQEGLFLNDQACHHFF